MKMKKIFNILLISSTLIFLVSCGNEWLDLKPNDAVDTEDAISSYEDLVTAKAGMYDGLQGNSSLYGRSYYAGRFIYYGEVRADDMQSVSSGKRSSALYEMRYTVDDAPQIWLRPYDVIRRANNIIKAVDEGKVTTGTADQIGDIYNQALVVRALAHFDLVRVYGKPYDMDNGESYGVPIVLTPIESTDLPARNSVAEVYTQVIKDLTDAINSNKLSKEKSTGYVNVWVAKSLLSRVYLYKGDNENSFKLAEDVIKNSPYTLWTNSEYASAWTKEGTSEMIFELVNFDSDDWSDREFIGYLYNEDGYEDLIVTSAFSKLLNEDPNDVRQQIVLPSVKEANIELYGKDKVWINKLPGRAGAGDFRINNIPVFRLSEVYLNAAEAAFKNNDKKNAATYLLPIVTRANPKTTEVINESNITLERISKERRKELVGEGHRFFDAMRNNEKVVRYTNDDNRGRHYLLTEDAKEFDRTYFRAILPIPIIEVNANSTIAKQQNPDY